MRGVVFLRGGGGVDTPMHTMVKVKCYPTNKHLFIRPFSDEETGFF